MCKSIFTFLILHTPGIILEYEQTGKLKTKSIDLLELRGELVYMITLHDDVDNQFWIVFICDQIYRL